MSVRTLSAAISLLALCLALAAPAVGQTLLNERPPNEAPSSGGFSSPGGFELDPLSGFGGLGLGGDSGPAVEQSTVSLTPEDAVVGPGSQTWIAYTVDIIPHWHVYWVNAGDAGQPTTLTWTAPQGVSVGPIVWPTPRKIDFFGFVNYGYEESVTLLIPVSVAADWPAGDPVSLSAEASWQVCGEGLCVPKTGTYDVTLPTGPETVRDPSAAALFADARAALPQPSDYRATMRRGAVGLQSAADAPDAAVVATIPGFDPAAYDAVELLPDVEGAIDHAQPQQVVATADGVDIVMRPGLDAPTEPGPFSGLLRLTSGGETGQVVEHVYVGPPTGSGAPHRATMMVTVAAPAADPAANPSGAPSGAPAVIPPEARFTVWTLLGLAFAGGLILNLMPCVFPVLAIKALSLASKAHADAAARRSQVLAYGAGVLLVFLALAGVMLGLKAAGTAVGWGFQLQSPMITAALAVVFLLVGLNMSGVFELAAPAGFGDKAAAQGGVRGAFFTGALAVVAATPCMAPFMSTAIPAALTGPPAQGLAIFAALGLGMAAPMMMLGVWPGLGRMLPRPGVWMKRLKELLAFPMYASAGWMLWVLSGQIDRGALFWALMAGALIGLAAWAYGLTQQGLQRRGLALGTAMVAALGALYMLATATAQVGAAAGTAQAASAFTRAQIAEARSADAPTFVYLTADWCATCKFNERFAFGDAYRAAIAETGAVVLKGDWTRPNPEIQAYLNDLGLAGIPVYAIYAPGAETPRILPQLLTEPMLVDALQDAALAQ